MWIALFFTLGAWDTPLRVGFRVFLCRVEGRVVGVIVGGLMVQSSPKNKLYDVVLAFEVSESCNSRPETWTIFSF